VLLSPAGDGIVEQTLVEVRCRRRGDLAVARCCYRVMLVLSLLRRLGHGAMLLSSHVVRPKSGFTTGAMMCDRSQDVPTL
jgi:hypothetical protein